MANLTIFLEALARLVAPRGVLLIGTLNRTLPSYVTAIIGAEYVLGWLPRGTHDWHKFVTPAKLDFTLKRCGFEIAESCTVAFNSLTMRWGKTCSTTSSDRTTSNVPA